VHYNPLVVFLKSSLLVNLHHLAKYKVSVPETLSEKR
jgi:hypothetical protein